MGLVARIVLGVQQVEVTIWDYVQTQLADALLDHLAPADQDGAGDALLHRLLGHLQDLVLLPSAKTTRLTAVRAWSNTGFMVMPVRNTRWCRAWR